VIVSACHHPAGIARDHERAGQDDRAIGGYGNLIGNLVVRRLERGVVTEEVRSEGGPGKSSRTRCAGGLSASA
jgi:hypothetical protein